MSVPKTLVLATGNRGKLREIRQVLGDLPLQVIGLDEIEPIDEPREDGATFADNARIKALYYAGRAGHWALADDSGLEVDALAGRPGVTSARYAAANCPPTADRKTIDAANIDRLLDELRHTPPAERTARFICHLALADGHRILIETFDTLEGVISDRPRGENGFGYDPVFYLPQLSRTAAQLTPEEKNQISHRGKAVRHFATLLRSFVA